MMDRLRFRISETDVARESPGKSWNSTLFTKTQGYLPGIPHNDIMKEVTYPRFVNVDDDLLLTYRIGQ